MPIPEDVPELGIREGDEGVIRRLTYLRNTLFAFVMVTYSTGQLRGWVVVEIKPERKVRSYTTASRQDGSRRGRSRTAPTGRCDPTP